MRASLGFAVLISVVMNVPHYHGAVINNNGVFINGNNNVNSSCCSVNNYRTQKNFRCVQVMSITGRGIREQFEEPCSNSSPGSLTTPNFVIIGDPNKTPLSLFTDTPNTLVIIRNGKCELRTYKTVNGVTTSKPADMKREVCEAVKQKMAAELEKNRIYWIKWNEKFKKKMQKSFPPRFPFHKPQPESEEDSSSEEEAVPQVPYVSVYRAGDLPSATSNTVPPTPMVTTSASPAPSASPVTVASSASPAPLTTTSNNLEIGGNDETNQKISIETSFPESKGNQCTVKISVTGNGVQDSFTEPCSKDSADVINREDIFIFGNPKKNTISLFSDEPSTLVVIKNKACTMKEYATVNGKINITKTAVMNVEKCSIVKDIIQEELEERNNGQGDKSVTNIMYKKPTQANVKSGSTTSGAVASGNNSVNEPNFKVIKNLNCNNGRCEIEVIVVGRGVYDTFKQCVPKGTNPKSITSGGQLVFGDPKNDSFCLFSNTPSTIVVIKGGACKMRKYTQNGTKSTESAMSNNACATAKNQMNIAINKDNNKRKPQKPANPVSG